MKKLMIFLLLPLLFGCSELKSPEKPKAKNIIFLIGDGMGVAQVYAAMSASSVPLNFTMFPVTGLSTTWSLSNYITDSAAGGTALATGNKTANGVIAMDTLGNKLKSILEIAEENGLATGLVSTSSITHATPAAFIAHQASRGSYEDIALDFLKTDIDVFIGGGYDHFANRADSVNLADSLKNNGYTVITAMDELNAFGSGKLAALLAPVHMPSMLQGRGDMLPAATQKALDLLSDNSNGFFLMVEGSQIDWEGHANNQEGVIAETLDFDKVLGIVLDFAKKEGNTLVVVTADHETGGMTITGGNREKNTVKSAFSTKGHSSVMVPVFAFGPGAEKFTGIVDNTEFFGKFMDLYGFEK
jgi:alkaline phosphatase